MTIYSAHQIFSFPVSLWDILDVSGIHFILRQFIWRVEVNHSGPLNLGNVIIFLRSKYLSYICCVRNSSHFESLGKSCMFSKTSSTIFKEFT